MAVVATEMSLSTTSSGGSAASGGSGVQTTPMLAVSFCGVPAIAPRMRSTSGDASGVVNESATRKSWKPPEDTCATIALCRTVSRSACPTATRALVPACAPERPISREKLSMLTATMTRYWSSLRLREANSVATPR